MQRDFVQALVEKRSFEQGFAEAYQKNVHHEKHGERNVILGN